ncbi:MAG: gfo/Idh/MocA family oxidoreductase [Chloroflexi bacterium]|nr:gfo/Idh/MocA family oxidoreductase [Chloroflexota bacterium]
MAAQQKVRVALVGLGFGAEFVPIYLHHPDVANLTICDASPQIVNAVGDKFEVRQRSTDFQQILNDDDIDAVHLVTPIPLHAQQSLAVLNAGKHCACTVPMALTLEDLHAIVAAQHRSGKVYMGMETAVYTRRFLYAQAMQQRGELGRIQFLRGAHYQDMEHWPPYWKGLPPMHYSTHAVAPILALAGTRARSVHSFGSGVMREELRQQYNNPYPIETAIFELESPTSLAAEVTRSLFHTARAYAEMFTVYGEKATFEWEQIEGEAPVVFRMSARSDSDAGSGRGNAISVERISAPDRPDLLPPEIARFTQRGVYDESSPHLSFLQGGGHDGSHPHLVHEFIRSIVEGRRSRQDAVTTANWNAPGLCAHQSALQGGVRVEIPAFEETDS